MKKLITMWRESERDRRMIAIVFSLVFAIISSILLYTSYKVVDPVENESLFVYRTDKNVNYRVQLSQNTYIQSNPQEMGKLYIARLVQSIPATMRYQYHSTDQADLDYTYRIDAAIHASYKTSSDSEEQKQVWVKRYTVADEQKNQVAGKNNVTIEEDINIDYQKYRGEVERFQKEMGLSVDAVLQVDMIVEMSGTTTTGEQFRDAETVSFKVPLNKDVFGITIPESNNREKTIEQNQEHTTPVNSVIFTIGIVTSAIAVLWIVILVVELLNGPRKPAFKRYLDKILSEYDDIIVETLTPIKKVNYTVINVKNMNEMVDLEQELRIPILYYYNEITQEATFTIIKDKMLYLYQLDRYDLDV